MLSRKKPSGKLGLLPLVAVIFFTVSGGPYGLEPLLYYTGGAGALLLLVAVPLMWDIPIMLAVMELNSRLPVTGGYYIWVKKALGGRWAFYEGWWSWLNAFTDLAIYPQLFVLYAGSLFPGIGAWRVPVCLAIVWICAGINILGVRTVGRASIWLSAVTILPFVALIAIGLWHCAAGPDRPVPIVGGPAPAWGMAILTIMWNFLGWDNVTTYAGEVADAGRAYRRAIPMAFVLIFVLYFGVTFVAQHSGISAPELREQGFPALGEVFGGHALAVALSACGMVSALGMFLGVMLSIARVPEVMAHDGMLPQKLTQLHPRFGSPYISILFCAVVVSLMTVWSFGELLVIDITVYFAGIVLELVSLWVLRRGNGAAPVHFNVPMGKPGVLLVIALPVLIFGFALWDIIMKTGEGARPLLFAVAMIVSGELARILLTLRGRKQA